MLDFDTQLISSQNKWIKIKKSYSALPCTGRIFGRISGIILEWITGRKSEIITRRICDEISAEKNIDSSRIQLEIVKLPVTSRPKVHLVHYTVEDLKLVK